MPVALAVCLLVVAPSVASAQSSAAPLATVISQDGLHLRSAPTTSATILTTIPFASVVTLTGSPTPDNWYPITYGNLAGWSLGDYLTSGAVDPAIAQTAPPLSVTAATALGPSAAAPPSPPALSADMLTPPAAPSVSTGAAIVPAGASNNSILPAGPSYSATATYYGVDDSIPAGQLMACGAPFDPMNAQATATNDWPCGTRLRVTAQDGTSIVVTVTDHGEYPAHWLDLTYAAFGQLADHATGRLTVTVTPLQ